MLFARSIADNISYGLTSVSFESVVQSAQKANAHAFISELQDGYHTGIENYFIGFCAAGVRRFNYLKHFMPAGAAYNW